ncbi:hypothetical protein H310_15147, partial [Aphanomyces invadans]
DTGLALDRAHMILWLMELVSKIAWFEMPWTYMHASLTTALHELRHFSFFLRIEASSIASSIDRRVVPAGFRSWRALTVSDWLLEFRRANQSALFNILDWRHFLDRVDRFHHRIHLFY